jgi:hypothetical protein
MEQSKERRRIFGEFIARHAIELLHRRTGKWKAHGTIRALSKGIDHARSDARELPYDRSAVVDGGWLACFGG